MITATLLFLRLAAGVVHAAVELPARSGLAAEAAPAVSAAASVIPALSMSVLTAPSLPSPDGTPRPTLTALPFSTLPLDLRPEAGVYERRGVGLLVLDAKDSTVLHLTEGTRKAHAMIRGAVDAAESAASMFDGRVIRRLGDGSLIAFPSYESALGAAKAIQDGNAARREGGVEGPELRVGVHAGRVLVDATGAAPEIYGAAVERTLKLAASAGGGQVAVEGRTPAPAAATREPAAPRPVDFIGVTRAATMFAELMNFSDAFERKGRRTAYAEVKAFHAFVREVVERRGGHVVKNEGETVMASFPSAANGAAAAAEIRSWAGARVGLSWGRVIREERAGELDYFGNTVNAAARLMRLAGDGEALISGTASAEPGVEALLSAGTRERTRMKGFTGEIGVVRLPAIGPAAGK